MTSPSTTTVLIELAMVQDKNNPLIALVQGLLLSS